MNDTLNLADYQSAFQNETLALGELTLTTPQLVLCDPFLAPFESPLPFLHPVPTGTHRVEAAIKRFDNGDQRFAYVRILFNAQSALQARYFELGVTAETVNEDFAEGEFVGTVCETGYLALLDGKTVGAFPPSYLDKACVQFERDLERALAQSHVDTYRHAQWTFGKQKRTLLAFTAGWGEGVYPVFFGYTHEPREDECLLPVCAVVALLLDH